MSSDLSDRESAVTATTPVARTGPGGLWAAEMVLLYVGLVVLGVGFFRTATVTPAGNELSFPRSVFTVCNAISLTGFEQTITVESYKPPGQVAILLLMIAGTTLSIVIASTAVVRLVRLPYRFGQIVWAAAIIQVVGVLLGATVLRLTGNDAFAALFQAASALGNCGITVGRGSGLADYSLHVVILPLSVLGGLGLPVLLEMFDRLRSGRPLSFYSRSVLALAAGVYLTSTAVLLLLHWSAPGAGGAELAQSWREPLLESSTTALNSRTLGWPAQSPAQWPRQVQWTVILLMLIGGAPASAAGGIKITTLLLLFRGIWSSLRGVAPGRLFGIALVWVMLYLVLVLLTMLHLMGSEPQTPADQLLFMSASAVGNVGLSFSPISVSGDGMYTLSAAMLLGRLLPLGVLWCAVWVTRDADLPVA